jgi:long-chain acyl-CoA synthetase
VHAVVVLAPGEPVGEAELLAHARASLARFKVPSAVHVVPELPHSLAGKVSRARLRELGLERIAAAAEARDAEARDAEARDAAAHDGEVSGG